MFFRSPSSLSSSDEEGVWPPPGRRRRHPAGNRTDTAYSDGSQSCISKLLDSPGGISFRDDTPNENSTMFLGGRDRFRKKWENENGLSHSVGSSSGFYSRPTNQSFGGQDSPFFPVFSIDNGTEKTDECADKLTHRFANCTLDTNLTELDDSATPPMLRRFLNSQALSSTTPECSFSCPPERFHRGSDRDLHR